MRKTLLLWIFISFAAFWMLMVSLSINAQDKTLQDQLDAMRDAVDAIPSATSECPPPVVCKECPVCPDPKVEPFPVECPDGDGSVVVVEKIVEVPVVARDSDTQAMIDMAKSLGIRTEIDRTGNGVNYSWTYPQWIIDHMGATDGMRGYMHNEYSNGAAQ